MKKKHPALKIALATFLIILMGSQSVRAQPSISGTWEGMFMEDFRTVLELTWNEEKGFTGFIMMYNGAEQIQDDALSNITLEKNKLTFYIQAKETSFEGTLNSENDELSGKFTFPDGSRHPLVARKETQEK